MITADNPKAKILVLGGYGNFGKYLCLLLAKHSQWEIVVAGRSLEKAQALVTQIQASYPQTSAQACILDWQNEDFVQKLQATQANVVIHAAGPFQEQPYIVAQACIELKIHYLDLADGREFVTQIIQLNEKAQENGVVVISGASVVPGLSSVVVDKFAAKYAILREIDFGIAPGNQIQQGTATAASILGYTGKAFQRLDRGAWRTVYGWQNLHQHYYGDNLGLRWHGNCDIPDLTLLPEKYPMLKTVVFHASLEVFPLHLFMWQLSWLRRGKIVKNWAYFLKPLTWLSHLFKRFGSKSAGMYIHLSGSNHRYQPLEIKWTLVAQEEDGYYLPAVPSVILIEKILKKLIAPGARPCVAMFTLEEFDKVTSSLNVYHTIEEKEF